MNTDLLELAIGLAFSVVIWLVVAVYRRMRHNAMRSSLPPQAVLEQHLATLRQMRSANAGYYEQLNYLRQQGLHKEVAENLIVLIEKESRQ